MSSDNKDKSFTLLAHEKKISELYQNSKKINAEEPSALIDSGIMAIAKQHLLDTPCLLSKDQMPTDKSTKSNTHKISKWPFLLVASVGLLSVLLMTQKDYFIHPNNIIAGDASILNEPVMQSRDIGAAEILAEEIATEQSVRAMAEEMVAEQSVGAIRMVASAQKYETVLDQELTAKARKSKAVRQTPEMLSELMLNKVMLEDN